MFVYSVRYYPRFHVTAVGLGTYYPRIWGIYVYVHIPLYPEDGGSRMARNTVTLKIYGGTSKKTAIVILADLTTLNLLR
jgi:hypothetical protein